MKYKSLVHFFSFAFALLWLITGCQDNQENKRFEKQKASLTEHIGEEFKISGILDSSGNPVKPDFTKSDLTIVDFWFNDCPPCIKEMNQFAEVLAGKEKKVSVISISINQPWYWKETLKTDTGKFAFLQNKLSNWTHYVLQTAANEKLRNNMSSDRLLELQKTYDVTFFPAYFVVDRNGIIQNRPESAVDYIKRL